MAWERWWRRNTLKPGADRSSESRWSESSQTLWSQTRQISEISSTLKRRILFKHTRRMKLSFKRSLGFVVQTLQAATLNHPDQKLSSITFLILQPEIRTRSWSESLPRGVSAPSSANVNKRFLSFERQRQTSLMRAKTGRKLK